MFFTVLLIMISVLTSVLTVSKGSIYNKLISGTGTFLKWSPSISASICSELWNHTRSWMKQPTPLRRSAMESLGMTFPVCSGSNHSLISYAIITNFITIFLTSETKTYVWSTSQDEHNTFALSQWVTNIHETDSPRKIPIFIATHRKAPF